MVMTQPTQLCGFWGDLMLMTHYSVSELSLELIRGKLHVTLHVEILISKRSCLFTVSVSLTWTKQISLTLFHTFKEVQTFKLLNCQKQHMNSASESHFGVVQLKKIFPTALLFLLVHCLIANSTGMVYQLLMLEHCAYVSRGATGKSQLVSISQCVQCIS